MACPELKPGSHTSAAIGDRKTKTKTKTLLNLCEEN